MPGREGYEGVACTVEHGAWSTGVEEVVYRKYQDLARLAYCQMNAYKDGR